MFRTGIAIATSLMLLVANSSVKAEQNPEYKYWEVGKNDASGVLWASVYSLPRKVKDSWKNRHKRSKLTITCDPRKSTDSSLDIEVWLPTKATTSRLEGETPMVVSIAKARSKRKSRRSRIYHKKFPNATILEKNGRVKLSYSFYFNRERKELQRFVDKLSLGGWVSFYVSNPKLTRGFTLTGSSWALKNTKDSKKVYENRSNIWDDCILKHPLVQEIQPRERRLFTHQSDPLGAQFVKVGSRKAEVKWLSVELSPNVNSPNNRTLAEVFDAKGNHYSYSFHAQFALKAGDMVKHSRQAECSEWVNNESSCAVGSKDGLHFKLLRHPKNKEKIGFVLPASSKQRNELLVFPRGERLSTWSNGSPVRILLGRSW